MNATHPAHWESVDASGWAALTESSNAAVSAFQTNAWLQLLESCGHRIERLRVTVPSQMSERTWQAGFCALNKPFGPFSRLTMPLLTPYLGWVLPRSDCMGEVASPTHFSPNLDHLLRSLRPGFPVEGVCSPPDFNLIENPTPASHLSQTCFLDLRPGPDSIPKSLNSQAGRHLRKIERNPSWTIRQADGDQLLPSSKAFDLLSQVWLRRGQNCPIPQGLFTALWAGSVPAGFRRNWVAFDEGQPRAFVTTVEWDGVLNYAIAACHPQALSSGIATALVVHSAQDGAERGLQFYDLVGANIPSIRQFKFGLGARLVPYPCHHRHGGIPGIFFRGIKVLKSWVQ